jgi:hypothetical protein
MSGLSWTELTAAFRKLVADLVPDRASRTTEPPLFPQDSEARQEGIEPSTC